MIVWLLIIFAWLAVLSILAGMLDLKRATAIFVTMLLFDIVAICIWASDYALRYYQVWPYLPQ